MAEHFLFKVEFQWFFIALSVRPDRRRAMVAHLLPNRAWARIIVSSSSDVNALCSTWGESWLHHLNRHDFPDLPGMDLLIKDQLRGPCFCTSFCKASSSSGLHGPLIRSTSFLVAAMSTRKSYENGREGERERLGSGFGAWEFGRSLLMGFLIWEQRWRRGRVGYITKG